MTLIPGDGSAKFVQIAVSNNRDGAILFALDENGDVWFRENQRWVRMSSERWVRSSSERVP